MLYLVLGQSGAVYLPRGVLCKAEERSLNHGSANLPVEFSQGSLIGSIGHRASDEVRSGGGNFARKGFKLFGLVGVSGLTCK